MRGWDHGNSINPVFTGSQGACGADGGGAPARVFIAMGSDRVDSAEDRPGSARWGPCGEITRVWHENFSVYGVRKAWRQLNRESIEVARRTVARLMRNVGLKGAIRRAKFNTTIPDESTARPLDLVERQFTAQRPNPLWVAGFTPTWRLGRASCPSPSRSTCSRARSSAGGYRLRSKRISYSMRWSRPCTPAPIPTGSCTTATGGRKVDSNGRCNISILEVLYGTTTWLGYRTDGTGTDALARPAGRQSAGS